MGWIMKTPHHCAPGYRTFIDHLQENDVLFFSTKLKLTFTLYTFIN
jgi:hypothetical protein